MKNMNEYLKVGAIVVAILALLTFVRNGDLRRENKQLREANQHMTDEVEILHDLICGNLSCEEESYTWTLTSSRHLHVPL